MTAAIPKGNNDLPPSPCEDLTRKVALVTGAGSMGDGEGIGKATAILLARYGAAVGLLDRHADRAESTASRIRDAGGRCEAITGDVSHSEQCKLAVDAVVATFGRIDILVNNVGVQGPIGNVVEVPLDEWDAGLRANLTSMVLMSRFAIPAMRAAGGGSIVNVSSTAALIAAESERLLYPTTKGAVIALSRTMARQHGGDRIRVNTVIPGMVATPRSTSGIGPEELRRRVSLGLLPIEGTAFDVAKAIIFLASDMSRFVTGTTLVVDGGFLASGGT